MGAVKSKRGGKRIVGPGKKIGRPVGTHPPKIRIIPRQTLLTEEEDEILQTLCRVFNMDMSSILREGIRRLYENAIKEET